LRRRRSRRSRTFDDKNDLRAGFDRFNPDALAANQRILDLVAHFARRENATPAQVALAWVMAQRPWIVPMPGTRSLQHLHENIGAIDVDLGLKVCHGRNAAASLGQFPIRAPSDTLPALS